METTTQRNTLVDMTGVKAKEGFALMPAGKYLCATTGATVKENKAKTGEYINLELSVLEPEGFKGRKLWKAFVIADQDAEKLEKQLGYLKGFLTTVGHPDPNHISSAEELVGYRVVANVKEVRDSWGEKNEVSYFEEKSKWKSTEEKDNLPSFL